MPRGKGRARDRAKEKSKERAVEGGAGRDERSSETRRALDRVTLVLTLVGVCAFAIFTGYLVGQYAIRWVASPLITSERAENPGTRLADGDAGTAQAATSTSQGARAPQQQPSQPPTSQSSSSSQAASTAAQATPAPGPAQSSQATRASQASINQAAPAASVQAPAPQTSSSRPQAQSTSQPDPERATIYRVQVGRFSSRAEATRQADALKSGDPAVPDAWVLFDNATGQYRVQAGAFSNRQRAQEFVDQLVAKGLDAYIAP